MCSGKKTNGYPLYQDKKQGKNNNNTTTITTTNNDDNDNNTIQVSISTKQHPCPAKAVWTQLEPLLKLVGLSMVWLKWE